MKSRGIRTSGLLTFLFLLVSALLPAQQYLILKKKGEVSPIRYQAGDEIRLLLENGPEEEYWLKGEITRFDSLNLWLESQQIPLNEIKAVRDYPGLLSLFGKAFMGGAVLFSGLSVVNGVLNNDPVLIQPSQAYWSLGFLGAGIIMHRLGTKTYRSEKGWYFQYYDLEKTP